MDPDLTGATPEQDADPWSWVDAADATPPVDLSAQRVTAVLVARDGAEWLPAALAGLAALDTPPDRVVLVDVGSGDDTGALLAAEAERHPGWQVVTAATGRGGFGDAVRAALASLPDGSSDPAAGQPTDWLWLLHDDAVPEPGALRALLIGAIDRGAALVTPKLVQPRTRQQPSRISELGASVARSGRRDVHADHDELDQGQHDEVRPVLGASTCGLLIRRDVFDSLGGLHPDIPGHRDGVEFGWRATLAGHTVLAVPDARVSHRQAGLAGLRAGTADAAAQDRTLGMVLVTAHAHGLGRFVAPVRLVVGCLLRAIGYLLGKAPDRAADEMRAVAAYLGAGPQIAAVRAASRAVATPATARAAAALRPRPFAGVRRVLDNLGAAWADRRAETDADRFSAGAGPLGTNLDELTGDDFAGHGSHRRIHWSASVVAVVAAVVLALVASRTLFGAGRLAGPALLPATDDVPSAFAQWLAPVAGTSWWQGPPWLGLHALLSVLTIGQPEWASTLLVAGMVPLAVLAVLPLARRIVVDQRVRLWLAVGYGVLPVLLGGSTQGRLSLALVAVTLPLLAAVVVGMVRRIVSDEPSGTWRHAWGAGLLLVVLLAHLPLLGALVVVAAAAGVVAVRLRHGSGAATALAARTGLALAVPVVALIPWWPALLGHPGWWLLGPDAALAAGLGSGVNGAAAMTAPAVTSLLLGRPGGPGMPPAWLSGIWFGVVWLMALAGALLRAGSVAIRATLLSAVGALLVAALVTRTVVAAPPAEVWVRPSAAVLLLAGFGALLVAGALGVDELVSGLAGRDFSWIQPVTAVAGVVLALVSLLGVGWWVVAGGAGPTARTAVSVLPGFASDTLAANPGQRALVIDATGTVKGHLVVDGAGARLGDADRGWAVGADPNGAARAADLTGRLLVASGDEAVVQQLRALGVRYVAVRGPAAVISGVNNTLGLRVVSVQRDARVWEVTGTVEVVPATADPTPLAVGAAIGQGAWLLVAAFCAAPRLRRSRSLDPAQRARHAAGQEVS